MGRLLTVKQIKEEKGLSRHKLDKMEAYGLIRYELPVAKHYICYDSDNLEEVLLRFQRPVRSLVEDFKKKHGLI